MSDELVTLLIILAAAVFLVSIGAATVLHKHLKGIRRVVLRHLGSPPDRLEVLGESIELWDRINIYSALEQMRQEAASSLVAYQGYAQSLLALLEANPTRAGIRSQRVASGVDASVDIPENVIYLLRHDAQPLCAILSRGYQEEYGPARPMLELAGNNRRVLQSALNRLMDLARELSVYKGKMITLEDASRMARPFDVRFHDIARVRREEIILPEEIMEVLDRNVLGLLEHADTLHRAGRSTRHGLLLHGPPGVGKTLAVSYLVHACRTQTVILLTGRNLALVRESMRMARLLSPSIVIFEDVDLIARERSESPSGSVLHELLDELDGMGRKTECILLLTTNRPELLEPALAARPGRVDQAIEFPLPDGECRRRLLELYGHGLDLSQTDIDGWVEKTDGVSPAFIAEWLRKAALLAAERGETFIPLPLCEDDLERAVRELVFFGGRLTQSLLGYRPGRPAFGFISHAGRVEE